MQTLTGRILPRALRRAIAAFTVVALLGGVAYATPSTPEIETVQAQVREAHEHLDELAAMAEMRAEEYEQISVALEQTKDEIADAREELAAADAALRFAQEKLQDRLDTMYRKGSIHFFEVLLGTNSFAEFLTRVEWLRRVGESDAALIASVAVARDAVISAERALARRSEEQSALRSQADAKLREVDAALERQESFVDNLTEDLARLIAEEEERLRIEAEERARKAAEEAARRAAELEEARRMADLEARRRSADTTSSGGWRSAARNTRTFDPGALGAGSPHAVGVAMKYLGVPYVWGGSTPAGFDCSGLVQYVFREIGISIPRTSREQFRVGAYIPPDRLDLLLPGDLVFFGYGGDPGQVHHVGMYVGNGDYLHAPRRGQPVQVNSLTSRINVRGDYVGATRP